MPRLNSTSKTVRRRINSYYGTTKPSELIQQRMWTYDGISLWISLFPVATLPHPVPKYETGTWALRAKDTRKLKALDHWRLRRLLRIDWRDRGSARDKETAVRHLQTITPQLTPRPFEKKLNEQIFWSVWCPCVKYRGNSFHHKLMLGKSILILFSTNLTLIYKLF